MVTYVIGFIFKVNVVVFTIRRDAGCFQAQYKDQQTANVSRDKQWHLHFVTDGWKDMNPPGLLLQIHDRHILIDKDQRPENEQN